jgi:hypothetical protein
MKSFGKIIVSSVLLITFFITPATTIATSQDDLFDFLDSLAEASTFGYTDAQKISIKENNDTSVTITAPVIADDLGTTIQNYTLQYATQPSLDLIEDNKADEIMKKDYNFPNAQDTIDFVLTAGDEIEADTTYYVSLIPKNEEGFPGDGSNEISFNLDDLNQVEEPTPTPSQNNPTPNNNDEAQQHNTAPDMCAANISYTQNNNNITVTWDAINPSARVNVYLRHASERDFRKITTVKISDESYTFVATRNGTHYIKMEPINTDGQAFGKECVQTLRLQEFTKTTIPVAPNNGPETTILLAILGITLFGYLTFRRRQIG